MDQNMEMRSSLGRVRGLGSTNQGVGHWWAQRVSGIALVPLVLWFVFQATALVGADLATFQAWVGTAFNPALLVLLIVTLFYHAHLGLTVVIEDYVHNESIKTVGLIAVKLGAAFLAVCNVYAVLKLTFGS